MSIYAIRLRVMKLSGYGCRVLRKVPWKAIVAVECIICTGQLITLAGWEQAGMASDSTLGYAGLRGFSCGTCHGHQGYVLVDQQASDMRIWLLMVMDVLVASAAYLVMGAEKVAEEVVERLESVCRDVGGVFMLFWQNFNLTTSKKRGLHSSLLG